MSISGTSAKVQCAPSSTVLWKLSLITVRMQRCVRGETVIRVFLSKVQVLRSGQANFAEIPKTRMPVEVLVCSSNLLECLFLDYGLFWSKNYFWNGTSLPQKKI